VPFVSERSSGTFEDSSESNLGTASAALATQNYSLVNCVRVYAR
jgi:hypothetical protein